MNKFLTLSLSLAAVAGLASCDNQVKEDVVVAPEVNGLPEVVLPQAPDLVISSNGVTLAGNATKAVDTRAVTKYENDEVEVNLALEDVHMKYDGSGLKYDLEDLVSHLTIHVRGNSDVEVTLPVPAKYYCDQDDLYIYTDRNEAATFDSYYLKASIDLEGAYWVIKPEPGQNVEPTDETKKELTKTTVALNIKFNPAVDATDESEGSITVWTSGVTEDVLNYCKWNYGDGLTFDAYNYYNRGNQYTTGSAAFETIKLDGLKTYLDNSTIVFGTGANVENAYGNFTESKANAGTPNYYINAFTGNTLEVPVVAEGEGNEVTKTKEINRDCVVKPAKAQEDWFYTPVLGDNGLNRVYVNKSLFGTTDPSTEIGDQPGDEVEE